MDMEKNFKRLCAALLTASILLTLASCGDDKASEDNTTTTESTTITTTKATEKITEASTTTTAISTTEVEETKATQKTTKADKTEATQAKPTQVKPTESKPKPTQAKPTEAKTTEAKPQKATPKFVFTQSLPVKVTAFSAEFEVVKANTGNGYWYNEDTYLFDISITVKRCDDGINEEKASAVQMTIKDSNGNVVRSTSTSAGMLSIGEQGTGCMAWSVDSPGTYTIEFSSI